MSAAVRLMPSPPALVLSRNTKISVLLGAGGHKDRGRGRETQKNQEISFTTGITMQISIYHGTKLSYNVG